MEPGEFREAAETLPLGQQELAMVIVTRLVVPDDGDSDEEVLKRAVELVARDDVAQWRAELQHLVGSIPSGVKSSTVAGEVEDLVAALNKAIGLRTKRQRAAVAVQLITLGQGAAGITTPLVGLAAGPTAAVSEAAIQRR